MLMFGRCWFDHGAHLCLLQGDPEHGVMGIRGHVRYLMIGNQNRLRDDLKATLLRPSIAH
jgi:hypothetical protein